MKKLLSLLTVFSLAFAGCASWRTQYTGIYKGKKFKLQSREVKAFSSNHFDLRISYANYKPIYLDPDNLDWGPPYSTDIYAEKSFLIKNNTIRYANDSVLPGKKFTFSSMLYIPFKTAEDKIGNQYFDLINENWALFDSLFQPWQQSRVPVILGIVQGSKASFTNEFKGRLHNKKVKLVIENDGRVVYRTDKRWSHELYSGLSRTVQMPGKVLYLKADDNALTLDEIKVLKNKYGTDPTHYFDIQVSK